LLQQTLHQSFANTKIKSHFLCESTTEQSFINGMRDIDILTQISYNIQKINEEDSWKKVNGEKKNRSFKQIMSRKQPKWTTIGYTN